MVQLSITSIVSSSRWAILRLSAMLSIPFILDFTCFSRMTLSSSILWSMLLTTLVFLLVRTYYTGLIQKRSIGVAQKSISSQTSPSQLVSRNFRLTDLFARIRNREHKTQPVVQTVSQTPSSSIDDMRYPRHVRLAKKKKGQHPLKFKQPYDVFLVLDIEATCQLGTDFNFPNEIIEFPICLMKWKDKTETQNASELEVVDEFRTFVKPSWRPTLSHFCTELTGITQQQVDAAPLFEDILHDIQTFLVKHGLIDPVTGERLVRFCWCSDGPFDIRDFVVKQCFISQVSMPKWIQGDVFDVRMAVMNWANAQPTPVTQTATRPKYPRRSLNISAQLKALGLPAFEGRQHSGIDDTRNIAKIVTELARRGVCLQPNTSIHPDRRWLWMGKYGQILEEYCMY